MCRPMALATQAKIKTQTRRLHKLDEINLEPHTWTLLCQGKLQSDDSYAVQFVRHGAYRLIKSPLGIPGDRIWVREEYYQQGSWHPVPGVLTGGGRQKYAFKGVAGTITFDQPDTYAKARPKVGAEEIQWYKRLGRFMPKSAARIHLEITGVRVERLHHIGEQDAKAEGCEPEITAYCDWKHRVAYKTLWETLNGVGSWQKNPFVWVYEYQLI